MRDSLKLTPLPVADWEPVLAHVAMDMQGRPLNVHALMANHPELLLAWWDFRNHAVNGGALGRRGAELVILRVAVHMRSWYEWASHVERALACGLSMEEVERVWQGPKAVGWAPSESCLLQAVDEMLFEHAITPATLSQLAEHYHPRQVLDMIAIHGMYVILATMLNTWDVELDRQTQDRLPAHVTRADFEEKPACS